MRHRQASRMKNTVSDLQARLRRRTRLHLALLLAVMVGTWLLLGGEAAIGAALGYTTAAVNALLLHHHLIKAMRMASADPHRNLRFMYRCALERFVVTLVLFTLGIGVLKLPVLPLLGGFVFGLFAQYANEIFEKA